MRYFCTYFDSGYLVKGLALYRSLVRHAAPFRLWILCFDDLTYKTLQDLKLDEVVPISLKDFESGDEELLQAKANRSRIEYYFTCTPSLPLYVLRNYSEVDLITYLDADLFFFSNPSPIYGELGNNSILIIRHRFPPHFKHLEDRGIYNVGLLSFRRDDNGLTCLHWWRERCIEWCYDRVENNRFADQKYLDDWPIRFPGVVVLQHKGAGLAPWNVVNYFMSLENGRALIDSQTLVFFHFEGLKQIRRFLYDPNLAGYGMRSNSLIRRYIYKPYIRELYVITRLLLQRCDQFDVQMKTIRNMSDIPANDRLSSMILKKIKQYLIITKKVLKGDLWVVIRGRVV